MKTLIHCVRCYLHPTLLLSDPMCDEHEDKDEE